MPLNLVTRYLFTSQRRLKQGDHLTPFSVAEALSMYVKKEETLGICTSFKVGRFGLSVTHLQYIDDTFIGKTTMENLWAKRLS